MCVQCEERIPLISGMNTVSWVHEMFAMSVCARECSIAWMMCKVLIDLIQRKLASQIEKKSMNIICYVAYMGIDVVYDELRNESTS